MASASLERIVFRARWGTATTDLGTALTVSRFFQLQSPSILRLLSDLVQSLIVFELESIRDCHPVENTILLLSHHATARPTMSSTWAQTAMVRERYFVSCVIRLEKQTLQ
jgi:hypothetical protein